MSQRPSVVALGGGHGLAANLSALRLVTSSLTAIVTVADDGGSSGRIREEMEVLPPGDLRMALSALCDDTNWGRTWRDLMQYRFSSQGQLDRHAVGNLLIVALWQIHDDPVKGLDLVGELLGARGRVLPMSLVPLTIAADIRREGRVDTVRGQARVAVAPGRVEQVRLDPPNPPACPEAVAAINQADWVVFGPGSWYTSVIPHVLVPNLAEALANTKAKRCLTLNLSPERIETAGMSAADHIVAWSDHAGSVAIDVVVADPTTVEDLSDLAVAVNDLGANLVLRQVRVGDGTPRHDPVRLAAAYRDVFESFYGDVGECA